MVAILESSYSRLSIFCVKFRTEDRAVVAFWACGTARNDETHSHPPFNQQVCFIGGVARTLRPQEA